MDSSRSAQSAEVEHASQIYRMMKEVYGEQCLARCTIFRWCQCNEARRVNIKDLPRPGTLTVTAEDDDDNDVTPVNPIKISHSEAVATLNKSLEWVEEQNFEAHEIMLLRRLRDLAFELKIGTVAQKNH
ncbi:hypothetical protein AVEN_111125-1 [Araneus ventricosus]|uniref:Uncharacterized protein n=1 Tax=Araneus ventricosus TaxID=182803 RepID=A0A4Y2TCB9_ARAVE|nr:hypothetical protein AVEN_26127-1 [Araneus ventricosus]GBN97711.1 hypothetical protein AVEN_145668-1 [Araneus ventricosus]GBN98200.1 hypothetical protein AVEN_45444-1 [Araneus ventricosus]GBN98207.1 hypothetical protein AVEN_111125-1 [Araneus ventricosus]